ncbi:MAG: hypothetical protein A2406_00900 [Candidatus Komeilibacteria bacterium RIFOXYC1_FULL_37_11]|uniref:YoaR-like putative peptidoglycan binding domain-containing protein n=1 Tax=Candidatus Komeilibacteria bacterium RIFOXYC1_FULL_37_11 TaxID=1798555 RepID=A0A1G2BYK2_9BACT|nr:MAG: hypothetical protein A2406_00900 [Candidatus Komeilibacteria bacterium RIFOXYC1_FULL_37_11]OGY95090.1 MAG: hypothetical protein A2611_00025 [Candidatus Komeilibacteria bacterium RIFOXYD1_FULL_37_29]
MEEVSKNKIFFYQKRLWIIIAIFVCLAGGVAIAKAKIDNNYQDKFLPNIKIGGVDIGGLSTEEARTKIGKRIDFVNRRGFVYLSSAKTVTINPNLSGLESADSLKLMVSWDLDKSLIKAQAWQKGAGLIAKLQTFAKDRDFPLYYNWDRDEHQKILKNNFSDILNDKKDASFYFSDSGDLKIDPESAGQTFNYEKALSDTQEQIENLISTDINLEIIEYRPIITSAIIESKRVQILAVSGRGNIYLSFEDQAWDVSNSIWRNWLELKAGDQDYYVGINKEKFESYLKEASITERINIPVQDARFSLKDGRVAEFSSSREGRAVNIDENIKSLENLIKNSGDLKLELAVETVQPTVHNEEVNDLGIVELLGTGESDFKGSPKNRIHNIGVGADALHGVLIKPDEEFSLINTLGDIDGEHGYLQELVIKGNRTIPEYGGGLCQIGTTVFRATLASGLPVTQRRNHSYRVSYYEPAGTDATIYDPWPDYRFKNDTGKYILIQARIEGTKVYFDFWGTKDGRVVMATQPEIYNIVVPPAKKIIKTTDIPVGTEKCTERAHNGADAKFNYSVQYTNAPEPAETIFYSHYIPWQEVCLLGVTAEELAAEQNVDGSQNIEGENATSTDDII